MDSQNSNEQQPGWTFKPGQSNSTPPPQPPQQEQPQQPQTQAPQPAEAQVNQQTPEDTQQSPQTDSSDPQEVAWTASEFIANHKSPGWYGTLFLAIIIIAGLTFLFTKDWLSSITIVIVGSLFAVLAGKKPRQLSYKVDSSGITIGDKFHPYHEFKSFTVLHEGGIGCINLLPLKRFLPELSIYYPPEEEDKILDVLTVSLPNDQKAEQSFDKFMKKIRF